MFKTVKSRIINASSIKDEVSYIILIFFTLGWLIIALQGLFYALFGLIVSGYERIIWILPFAFASLYTLLFAASLAWLFFVFLFVFAMFTQKRKNILLAIKILWALLLIASVFFFCGETLAFSSGIPWNFVITNLLFFGSIYFLLKGFRRIQKRFPYYFAKLKQLTRKWGFVPFFYISSLEFIMLVLGECVEEDPFFWSIGFCISNIFSIMVLALFLAPIFIVWREKKGIATHQ